MTLKKLQLFSVLSLGLGSLTALAAPVEYKIPASQSDFDAMWEVVPGDVDKTWEWVDFTTPHAMTPAVADGEKGATLIMSTPIEMKVGDIYNVQAYVTSANYNDDEWFYIVYGTDKSNLTTLTPVYPSSSFKCYNPSPASKTDPSFSIKPTDNSKVINVTEDGFYYIGIRSQKSSSNNTDHFLKFAGFILEKEVNHPQRCTGISIAVGAEGKMESTLSWTYPTKNKGGDAITENIGVNIYRSKSSAKADLYSQSSLIATISGAGPGDKGMFEDNDIPEAGKYYYLLAPYSSAGEYSQFETSAYAQSKWIGEDVEVYAPLNPSAAADGDNIKVSYTKRTEGKNSGWIDPAKLKHIIERSKDGGAYVVIEEAYAGESPYVDVNLDGPAVYSYRIKALYGENESSYTSVVSAFGGGAYDVPYTQDFTDASSINQFTILSSNSSYKWKRNTSGYAAFDGFYTNNVTSSLVTPALNLKAGKTYKVTANAWVNNSSSAKDMYITAGTEATDAGLATIETINITGLSSKKQAIEAYFAPEADGRYYIGFKGIGQSSSYYYLDDIVIEESVLKPAVVTDLTFTPDDHGANSATIAFTVPAKTNAGVALTELTKVEVTRTTVATEEAEVVKTLVGAACAPGTAVEFVDEVAEAGKYSYSVVSVLEDAVSEVAVSDVKWIGYDIPKGLSAYSGMSMSQDETTGTPVVTWGSLTGATLGENGGYVDADNLRYRVYRLSMLEGIDPVMIYETTEHTYADADIHDAPWSKYKYAVAVVNGPQEGKQVGPNNAVTCGKVALPYEPNLNDDDLVDAFEGSGFIGDNGMVCKLKGETEGKDYRVYLPAFDVNDAEQLYHKLSLTLSRTNGEYEELVEVYLHTIKADVVDNKSSQAAAVVLGKDNETLVSNGGQPISVLATADAPAQEDVLFTVPSTGRYRVSLKCVSANNKGLNVHALRLATEGVTAVDAIAADGSIAIVNGKLVIPADAQGVEIYAANGMKVAQANADFSVADLAAGFYIVRVTLATGEVVAAKIVR